MGANELPLTILQTTESFPSAAFAMSGKKEDEKKADLASEDQTQSDVKL